MTQQASNKIKFGLKNVHYALVNEGPDGAITYGTPKRLPGAVSLSLSPEGDENKFHADDTIYFSAFSNNGYSGDLEVALITDEFRIDVLGDKVDANGVIFEDSGAIAKAIALLFEFSGDAKNTRRVLYNVAVARPNIEGETKGETIDPKTEVLSMVAAPGRDTGFPQGRCYEGDKPYATWYDSVYTFAEEPLGP